MADVGPLEIDRAAHLFQVGFVPGQQIVDDDDLAGAFAQQRADNGGADETGPSRDNVVAHSEWLR